MMPGRMYRETMSSGATPASSEEAGTIGISAKTPHLLHQPEHLPRGDGTVADAVLLGRRQFGHARRQRRDEQQRVVAEAALAARRLQHLAVPAAEGDQRLGVVG